MRIKNFNIWKCCSTDEIRPALTGVFITFYEDKPVAVATDGFSLAIVPVQLEDMEEVMVHSGRIIIPAKSFKFIARNVNYKLLQNFNFSLGFDCFGYMIDGRRIYDNCIDDKFPSFETVIPDLKDKKLIKISINPNYLKRISDVVCFGTNNSPVLLMEYRENGEYNKPIVVKNPADKNFKGLIMPTRIYSGLEL